MTEAAHGRNRRRWGTPARVVGLQVVVTLFVAAAALFWSGDEAKSALLGGIVAFVPNAYFAWAASRTGRSGALKRVGAQQEAVLEGGRFLGRWLVKMGLMVALLVIALAVLKAGSLGFFAGLVAALMAQFASPWMGGAGNGMDTSGSQPRD
ncbi:MAG: ATP synthase subunit I [Gammaproteobacteria bacterium]|nr:ATP synthase subunit I [Gammaproteobacteria bacterium]